MPNWVGVSLLSWARNSSWLPAAAAEDGILFQSRMVLGKKDVRCTSLSDGGTLKVYKLTWAKVLYMYIKIAILGLDIPPVRILTALKAYND